MRRAVLLALVGAGGACAQLFPPPPPPPPDPNPPKYEVPPEEDESLATPKVYTFNPLQAKKEISTGDFYLKRGNLKGAAYRYREATLWDDGNPDGFFKLGDVSEKMRNFPTAREAFTKYLGLVTDKKKTADVSKRIAKYPPDTESANTKGAVGLKDALKEDRGATAAARAKGIIR